MRRMPHSVHRVFRWRLGSSGKLLALCLWFGTTTGSVAVERTLLQDMVLRSWALEDGLPSPRINAIVRTPDGYLWLATQRGLVRFDGARFVIFDAANTPGMKDERVSSLLLDSRGDLWAGMSDGVLLKRAGRVFLPQNLAGALPSRTPSTMAAGKVNAMAEDGQGALWLAIQSGGLVRFHNGRAVAFGTNSGLPSLDARKVVCDSGGCVWAVAGGQLSFFEGGRWRAPGNPSTQFQTVRTVSLARDGGLWVATGTVGALGSWDLRLYKFRQGRWSAPLEPYPWPRGTQQFQRLAVFEDQSGRIWCATAGGIFVYSPSGSWQQLLSAAPWLGVEVMCLAEDADGLLWLGTRTTGLLQVEKRQVMSLALPPAAGQHAVLTACAARDGSLWCGTDGAGIFRWRAEEEAVPFGIEQGLTNLHVATLLEDRHTNLWAGTSGGLFRRVGEQFEPVTGAAALREPILALLKDRHGNLWAGARSGLVRLGAEGVRLFAAEEHLFEGAIRALAESPDGHIWVGPNAGLFRLEGAEFQQYSIPQEPYLQGILALYSDRSGALWIGTDLAGLLRLRAGRFDQWRSAADGLPSDHITAILEDDQANLWISSENGIFSCPKEALDRYQRGVTARLQPTRLTMAEGLVHKVCSGVAQPAACKSDDGRLWFPNGPALAVFDPKTIPRPARVCPPLIESASVDGVPLSLLPGGLRVQSGARRIEFRYTSPNLLAPERVRFRFRLDGLDRTWVDAGSQREASYSRLPPGRYQFRVAARGLEDVWQEGAGSLSMEIVPRFWERRSFQLAGGLALLAGVAGAALALERSRSRRRLERLEMQRAVDAERQRIARDIHDDLGSGLTEIILLSDSLDQDLHSIPAGRKMVCEIAARARSLTRAMDEVVWAINPRNDTLEGLVIYLSKFAQDYLKRANLRCRWHVPLEVPELRLSAEVRHSLFLACKEALHNVVKHAAATEVSVGLELTEGGFTLSIEDNGRGFAADGPPGPGNGLANMRQRLKELGGQCRVASSPGRGTRVVFALRCGNHGLSSERANADDILSSSNP